MGCTHDQLDSESQETPSLLRRMAEAVFVLVAVCVVWLWDIQNLIGQVPSEKYLKFRARLSELWRGPRTVPKRNGIVQKFTDLEMTMQLGHRHAGERAEFVVQLCKMEDELLEAREAIASMRQEEERRTAPRRQEAVAATKRKHADE